MILTVMMTDVMQMKCYKLLTPRIMVGCFVLYRLKTHLFQLITQHTAVIFNQLIVAIGLAMRIETDVSYLQFILLVFLTLKNEFTQY